VDDELRRAERAGDEERVQALRARAGLAACGHGEPVGAKCLHLDGPGDGKPGEGRLGATWRFTGQGLRYDLLCPACAALDAPETTPLCEQCVYTARRDRRCDGQDTTRLVLPRRDVGLRVETAQATVELEAGPDGPTRPWGPDALIRAWAPLPRDRAGAVLALLADGRVVRVGLDGVRPVGWLGHGTFDLTVVLLPSPDGQLVAIAERTGLGLVVLALREPWTDESTIWRATRGDYQVDHCPFPLAWVEHQGKQLLVHAVDWNRLDVVDPCTGERPRAGAPEDDEDHFVGELVLSDDGRWLADGGWVWHPVGISRAWRLDRWLAGQPLPACDLRRAWQINYGLQLPHTFVGSTLFAWGIGDDSDSLLPGVRRFDVEADRELEPLVGPEGELFADGPRLVSLGSKGLRVWDAVDGALLLDAPGVEGTWHPGARAVVRLSERRFRVARVAGP
jgi:hypothetical protein